MSVTLQFHGAAGTVTGSCYRIIHPGGQFLVDCGLFQGNKSVRDLNLAEAATLAALVFVFMLGIVGVLWQWQRAEDHAKKEGLERHRAELNAASEARERQRADKSAVALPEGAPHAARRTPLQSGQTRLPGAAHGLPQDYPAPLRHRVEPRPGRNRL